MIKLLFEQGSDAWHLSRLGRVTGTRFAALMSKPSTKGYQDLIIEMAGEMLSGEIEETYTNAIMERGTELEPIARKAYEDEFGEVEQVGFCVPDEDDEFYEWIGVSPDGLTDGCLEIKCPLRKTHMNYIAADRLPAEYRWQVQGQLFVTGLPFCDFVSFYPGLKLFVKRVYPDIEDHNAIESRLRQAIKEVKEKIEVYNKYNYDEL